MHLKVQQSNLNQGLNLVSRIVPTRPNLPVLGNILLSAEGGKLTLSTTNLETGMVLSLKASVDQEGSISVPSRLFTEFIANLPPGEIDLSLKDKLLEISGAQNHSTLNGIDAAEFPPMPQIVGGSVMKIDSNDMSRAIEQVVFTASGDETRQVLTGALLTCAKGKLSLVATDGFRLSYKELPFESQKDFSFVIPARGFWEVSRVLKEKEFLGKEKKLDFGLTQEKNQAVFKLEGAEVSCRLLEGKFPEYGKIIPKQYVTRAILDREELVKAVKVASIFARDDANIIHFSFYPKEGKIKIAAQTKELGESQSETQGSVEGEPMDISFNSRFVLEVLGVLEASQVSLELSGSLSPAQVKAVGDDSFFHILMPIRTDSNE